MKYESDKNNVSVFDCEISGHILIDFCLRVKYTLWEFLMKTSLFPYFKFQSN